MVVESTKQFFKLESDNLDLILFLIIFIDENDCSHLCVATKRQALLWTNFLSFGKCSHDKDRRKLIACVTLGNDETSLNFIFSTEFAWRSKSSIYI